MYNSYQHHSIYQKFLQSKPLSQCIQQSEYIIEDNDNLFHINKENQNHINKSNFSQYHPNDKSNYSHKSMAKSGMMASKSQSFIMAQSKSRQLLESNRSKISQKNMLKSYNVKMGPALKVLTQSDLTENDQQDDHIFSDSQPQQTPYQNRVLQTPNINKNTISQPKYKGIMSKYNQPLIGAENLYTKNEALRQPGVNYRKKEYSAFQLSEQRSGNQSQEQQARIPDFTFIPNQKLQIRLFSPLNRQRVSFSQLISLLPHSLNALKKVKKLSVINCFMNSLEGIEQFECLQEVNLRKNELRDVEELYRIKNKQNISVINFIGNDIQHYHLARYRALTQLFPNLQEVNDKNYAMLKRKQRGDMKKVIQKSSKLEYELRKTLKKQTRQTDRAIFKMNPLLGCDQQQTERTQNRSQQKHYPQISDHRITQKDEYSYQNDGVYSNRHYNSSVSRRSASEIKSPTNAGKSGDGYINRKKREIEDGDEVYEVQQSGLNPNSYSLGQSNKQKSFCKTAGNNSPHIRPQLKEVSLGNLENVPITKSVKCLQRSPSKNANHNNRNNQQDKENINRNNNKNEIPLQTVPLTKNLLQIKTQDLDNESQLAGHLHQPTATFAMQKQREQQCSLQNKQFMFRNKKPNNQFTINTNNSNINTQNIINNSKAPRSKKQLRDQSQIFQEYEMDQDENEMSLSRISRISEIPTKRLSHNRRSMTSHNLKPQQRSKYYENYQNTSEQSFMTGNDFFPNQNNTYMGMSQLTQWRPNQSMDEDCLLKDKKDSLEEEKLVIATAVYMQNLLKKSLFAFVLQGTKRKNMPKKRVFF